MKQLYVSLIVVAVILLALLGLSKLNQRAEPAAPDTIQTPAAAEPATTPTASTSANVLQAIQDTTTMQQEATSTAPSVSADTTTVALVTSKGTITVELLTKEMPITAGNFVKLVQSQFYDGVKFHRVIDGFMIQGGDPLTKDDAQRSRWGQGGPGYTIPDEFGPRYSNVRGTVSMANAGPNTGGSQFFINTADNVFLDGKHPVFGRVVSGMDVVDAIATTPRDPNDAPISPVTMTSVTVIK